MGNHTEFNKQAGDYLKYRPNYPEGLFDFLAQISPSRESAYDAGTGNGQSAISLSERFERVFASDFSAEQISKAILKNNIHYFVADAHQSRLPDKSVDLVTAATAVHWFKIDLFFEECRRILKNNGVVAIWAYGWHQCENEEISKLLKVIGMDILGPFWSDPPKLIWDEYKTISFPFSEIQTPNFFSRSQWNMNEFIGYINTWSASQKYIEQYGKKPSDEVITALELAWGLNSKKYDFHAPLYLRVGKLR